ncbi:MAG: outer membrane beta-barrel protein [Candidatus Eisenbacteria bacterium]
MRHLSSVLLLGLAAALAPVSARAERAPWSLGSNLGVSFIAPDHGAHVTTWALPGSVNGMLPGLRLGRALAHPNAEAFLDAGLLYSTSDGAHQSGLALTGNYQWNFSPSADWTPYADLGLGLAHTSYEIGDVSASGTSLRLGVGGGARWKAGDSGTLRLGVRWDHDSRASDSGVVVNPGGSVITIKAGFDLWLR